MSGHWGQSPRSGHGEQNPPPGRGGQYPGLWRPNHGVPVPYASHFGPSRFPPPDASGPTYLATSHQYAPAPAPASDNHAPLFQPTNAEFAWCTSPAQPIFNAEFAWCPSPWQPPSMFTWQPPSFHFRNPEPRQLSPPPPPPGTSPKPGPPSYPPPAMPTPPLPLHPLGKRYLSAAEQPPDPKRARLHTMEVTYMLVLEFLDKNPPVEPFKFKVGSVFGDIPPRADYYKTTENGADVLDGFVEHFSELHAQNRSYGGNFDVKDMLVSAEGPLHVRVDKVASLPATRLNIRRDFMKLVNCLVKPRYGENGKKPSYVDDFISRIQKLSPKTSSEQWEIRLWVIRHHLLLVEPAKRRLLLEDFYKFYKTLNHRTAANLIRSISKFCHRRWHVLIAPKDEFITNVYWKKKKQVPPPDYRDRDYAASPDDNEEDHHFYPFTSEDGFLAVFLRTFLVHGPEEAWDYEIELEELDLIIAHYFGKLLPTFLEQLNTTTAKKYNTIKEILRVYTRRRSVSGKAVVKDEACLPSVW